MNRRDRRAAIKVIPRFVYNPEKADRGLKAMADILALALHCTSTKKLGEKSSVD
jgi:hypothetical protein